MGLVMAVMGSLGGLTFVLALQAPFREALGSVALGSLLGFGVGVFAPPFLKSSVGVEIGPVDGGVETLAAAAFVLGLAQERVLHLFIKPKPQIRGKEDA
jgi:hypothetical protein